MIEISSPFNSLSKAEVLSGLTQIVAFTILVIPAYGFLVVSHYLANYGLQSIYVPRSQFFAAGFATIITFLLAPACAAIATSIFFRSVRSLPQSCTFFAVLHAFSETLVLKLLYIPFPSSNLSNFWWCLVIVSSAYAIASYLFFSPIVRYFRVIKPLKSSEKRKSAHNVLSARRQGLTILLASLLLELLLLWRIDHTLGYLLILLAASSTFAFALPKIFEVKHGNSKGRANLLSIAALIIFYPCIFISVQGAIYGYLDSGWGGAGLTYARISLDKQSGMLAPCTWTVRLIEETETSYYVTFDHGSKYTNAYMIPKNKVSGIFFLQTNSPHILDLASNKQVIEPNQPTQVRAEQETCKILPALDSFYNKLDAPH